MSTLSIREMRGAMAHLDELLEKEGEILVTRYGKPVARVVPVSVVARQVPSHSDLRAAMPRLSNPSEELVRSDREDRG